MVWAKPKESRDQIVLFAEKLDDAVPANHSVRTLAAILDQIDWSAWEATYDLTKGQPPIHPRILAGVIIFGLLKRIRTSRALEEALAMRMDFRWLAEGRSIDHSTIAKFRTAHPELLTDLFVQIGLIAQQMGHLTLVTLGYDGTRLRASNRNTGTRTPEELRKAKQQLAAEFDLHREAIEKAQGSEDEVFDAAAAAEVKQHGEQLQRQSDRIEAALAEIAKIEASGKKVPARLPKKGEQDNRTFAKSAFLYDAEADIYYCPIGNTLERKVKRKSDPGNPGNERFIYRADKSECADCPLRAKCFKDSHNKYGRQIESGKNEAATQAHAAKMQETESREKYSRRAAVTERPFAVIKQAFGVREFLVRGLEKVRAEWRLLCIAHNVRRLFSLIDQQRARESIP